MVLSKVNDIQLNKFPPTSYRFLVTFLDLGIIPNPLDIGFQTVSGLSSQVETEEIREGGENMFMQRLPKRITYSNLVLTRGMVIGSLLNRNLNLQFSTMTFIPGTVLVILLGNTPLGLGPVAGWVCQEAYPVKWEVSDLDGSKNEVVIETMELAYSRLQTVRI
ncbi:MAG: phage tail protein [Symploca sp. SIO2D2]|nr:phage tail protein [Symploca sp. SIO2D2]